MYIKNLNIAQGGVRDGIINNLCDELSVMDELVSELKLLIVDSHAVPVNADPVNADPHNGANRIDELINVVDENFANIMPLQELDDYPLSCDRDIFFDKLSNSINKCTLKLQAESALVEKARRGALTARLNLL